MHIVDYKQYSKYLSYEPEFCLVRGNHLTGCVNINLLENFYFCEFLQYYFHIRSKEIKIKI